MAYRTPVNLTFANLALVAVIGALTPTAVAYEYPTEARVDYVLGCMASNGQTRLMLGRCACSIDYIAERLPYDEYVAVETVQRMQTVPGERTAMFRDSEFANTLLDEFKRLQVQADLACF